MMNLVLIVKTEDWITQNTLDGTDNLLRVVEAVAAHFGISIQAMLSKRRIRTLVYPRQVCQYLASELREYSLSTIGRLIGGKKAHATVLYSIETIENLLSYHKGTQQDISEIKSKLKLLF